MGKFAKGEVVAFPFPFTDLSGSKPRPALVVASLKGDDMILCLITKSPRDADAIRLETVDFKAGGLPTVPSYIRPSRLFTGKDVKVILSRGHVSPAKLAQVIEKLVEIVSRP